MQNKQIIFTTTALIFVLSINPFTTSASYHFANFNAHPPIHVFGKSKNIPTGLSPAQIKNAYTLPNDGGHGTIAIVGAYNPSTIENDLNVFSSQYELPQCTTANHCFTKHLMSTGMSTDNNWAMETSLDVEWAHAIAPQAKILLVSAKTSSGKNLLEAIDYAQKQSDVVAVSISWGGMEFPEETTLDAHLTSTHGVEFFASSGDSGAGVNWPAASPNVVAVGGTTLSVTKTGTFISEKAWIGSGGGISMYEKQPQYQTLYNILKANNMRSVPDVAYNADPASGFSMYKSGKGGGWYVVGGTSAGAPQWAAIYSLGLSATNENFYKDKAVSSNASFFRDIRSGSNGDCGYYCTARTHYDYITGLGSPLTIHF